MKRVLTALVLIPFALYCIFLAPPVVFSIALAVLASLCFYEYRGLVTGHNIPGPPLACYAIGVALLLLPQPQLIYFYLLAPLLLAIALRNSEIAKTLPQGSAAVLGIAYIYGAWRCGAELHGIDPRLLLFALGINWVGDTAAFCVGKAIGRHKLAPTISPGKSWEGAVGSVLVCAAAGGAFLHYVYLLPLFQMVCASIAANIAGQAGDLAESALKRGAGKKDSGHLLPGHGGWLDRLDSSLFSMPVVYVIASQINLSYK